MPISGQPAFWHFASTLLAMRHAKGREILDSSSALQGKFFPERLEAYCLSLPTDTDQFLGRGQLLKSLWSSFPGRKNSLGVESKHG
jgi:hypothetical protein